jgi:DNA-binding XRE family transcriptional regulator
MTIVPLKTYLKTYRRRTGFTHDEVAFLIGGMAGTSYSRHEGSKRLPILKTALMYEFIFDATVRELYEGVFVEVQERVRERARGLVRGLEKKPASPQRDQKIAALRRLLGDNAAGVALVRRHE